MFGLELVQAKEGDCVILHFDDAGRERRILVDGGPRGVYNRFLEPRLKALHVAAGDDELVFDLGVLSHIDADHVSGLLDLTEQLLQTQQAGQPAPYRFRGFWHNAFGGLTAGGTPAALARVDSAARTAAAHGASAALPYKDTVTRAVIASVQQGARLENNLAQLGVPRNEGFQGGLVLGPKTLSFHGLELTLAGPLKADLDALRNEWQKELPEAAIADYEDSSIPNLASIVMLVEKDGKSMLLTGDARGDKTLEGLDAAGKLAHGEHLELDLLKLPHHGSSRNVERDYFERLPARVYVVSANGRYGNPDPETFEMLVDARKQVLPNKAFEIVFAMPMRNAEEQQDLENVLKTLRSQRPFGYRFGTETPGRTLTVAL